jgi:hypothetical protein
LEISNTSWIVCGGEGTAKKEKDCPHGQSFKRFNLNDLSDYERGPTGIDGASGLSSIL